MSKNQDAFFEAKKNWSLVKDELLRSYLSSYFQKILYTQKPVLYIDGFSGKGRYEDGTDGSPRIALVCRESAIHKSHVAQPRITCAFIEKQHGQVLGTNLSDFDSVGWSIRQGSYESEIEKIISVHLNHNVFLYVDPYGVKDLSMVQFREFASRKYGLNTLELLINLNTFGLLRIASAALKFEAYDIDDLLDPDDTYVTGFYCSAVNQRIVDKVLGTDQWTPIIEEYKIKNITGYQAEQKLWEIFRRELRQSFSNVLDLPIRRQTSHHPKYRMVHASNHPEAAVLMADNICRRMKELEKIQHPDQPQLFSFDTNSPFNSSEQLQEKLMSFFDKFSAEIRLNVFLAQFFDAYGVWKSPAEIKAELTKLEKENMVCIRREPSTTTKGKPSRTNDDSKGKKVWIRKK